MLWSFSTNSDELMKVWRINLHSLTKILDLLLSDISFNWIKLPWDGQIVVMFANFNLFSSSFNFQNILNIYIVLSNEHLRAIYDIYGQKGLDAGWEVNVI